MAIGLLFNLFGRKVHKQISIASIEDTEAKIQSLILKGAIP
jgi:hypothetical protein